MMDMLRWLFDMPPSLGIALVWTAGFLVGCASGRDAERRDLDFFGRKRRR